MTTAGSARSSSTCTRKARRFAPSSTTSPSRCRSACNTACRWKNMSTPSPSPASSPRARCRATTPSSTRPRSSTMCSANSRSATCRASTSPMSIRPSRISTRSARASRKARRRSSPRNKYLSKGLTRSRTDNLVVMRGSSEPVDRSPRRRSNVTAHGRHGRAARISDAVEGAVALKQEAQHDLSPTEKLEALQWSKAGAAAQRRPDQGRTPRRSQGQGLRRRDVRRVRQLHAGAQRHLHEVRYVWQHDGVFVI